MGQTETKVAQVTLKDAEERNRTINIDNPKDNLSLNQIKAAFQPAIAGGWLLSSSGSAITEVVEAKYNQVIKTQINGVPVTVSPSSLTFNILASTAVGQYSYETLTVTNGTIAGIICPDTTEVPNSFVISNLGYNSGKTVAGIAVVRLANSGATYSGNLKIIIEGSDTPITVPVTVTQAEIS